MNHHTSVVLFKIRNKKKAVATRVILRCENGWFNWNRMCDTIRSMRQERLSEESVPTGNIYMYLSIYKAQRTLEKIKNHCALYSAHVKWSLRTHTHTKTFYLFFFLLSLFGRNKNILYIRQ